MLNVSTNFSGRRRVRQKGLALVSALLMLVIITLLGVSLFLGVTLQQKAAGNSLQKTRALEAAQSSIKAAENWLDTATGRQAPLSCTSNVNIFRICAMAPVSPADPNTWIGNGATQVNLPSFAGYAAPPAVWITYLGRATMGPGNLYQVDAQAYSGNKHTMAVIQTVYYVGGNMRNTTPAQNLGQ